MVKLHRDKQAANPPACASTVERADIATGAPTNADADTEIVLVEPFYGGSHKQLVDLLARELLDRHAVKYAVCSLPPRKWHWRLMASSMHFATVIPRSSALRVVFVTSMVNLGELLGLRPDLNQPHIKKLYYFHENQLTYPFQVPSSTTTASKQNEKRRKVAAEDFHIGWSQLISCLAADELLFNSEFNRTSFLSKVDALINKIPEAEMRQRGLAAQLRAKSRVLFFPLTIPPATADPLPKDESVLTILWNHRWEYDKNPDEFFQTLLELEEAGSHFQVIVLGEAFNTSPSIFQEAKDKLEQSTNVKIVHWGYAESKDHYFSLLRMADVVVSTSLHEFYGVAVLEAVLCGCFPLVPNRLVYPEFFSGANLFNTQRQLFKKLKGFCAKPATARCFLQGKEGEFLRFTWPQLTDEYKSFFIFDGIDQSPPTKYRRTLPNYSQILESIRDSTEELLDPALGLTATVRRGLGNAVESRGKNGALARRVSESLHHRAPHRWVRTDHRPIGRRRPHARILECTFRYQAIEIRRVLE